MKISYNWLKWYIPEAPEANKLHDIFTYHLCEVESMDTLPDGDVIFDINILPNRAHDLLSHQGIARELASLLSIPFVDPTPKYRIPEYKNTELKIKIESDSCRRYMACVVRNVLVGPSPEWIVKHLESIGARSINNIVDAANITMYDIGQPVHAFDLDKISGSLIVRFAKEGEEITTLDNKQVKLKITDLVIADEMNVLAIAGVKGGKMAEVDINTRNIVVEVANFAPVSTRKTARSIGIFTDAAKRFENDLSPSLCEFGVIEMNGLLSEYGFNDFEEIIDIYNQTQISQELDFNLNNISKILGINVSKIQIENILERYHLEFSVAGENYKIKIPLMRLDLNIEADIAEEVGRILGYDKLNPKIPKLSFVPKVNEVYQDISNARESLLNLGYNEVITYTFCNTGEVSVLASASDKKFLRTNITDGLKESIKLNQNNLPLLNTKDVKVFEIGKVFKNNQEVMNIAFGDKKEIKEMSLIEFITESSSKASFDTFSTISREASSKTDHHEKHSNDAFHMWSLFPFIIRDIAVWVPESESVDILKSLIKENAGELCIKGPEMFDSFTKEGRTSYGFRMIFQSYDKTLTDIEVNQIMDIITNKIKENLDWQVR